MTEVKNTLLIRLQGLYFIGFVSISFYFKMLSKHNKPMILAIMSNKHRSLFGRIGKTILFLYVQILLRFRYFGFGYWIILVNKNSTHGLIKLSRNIERLARKGCKPQVKIVLLSGTIYDLPEDVVEALSRLIIQVDRLKGSLWFDKSGIRSPSVYSRKPQVCHKCSDCCPSV